ncbi:Uncharacterized protein Fot_20224 [Forsythia ovata]|uniref:D-isomer specific 2-hydroxyacid dehydrogenase NAD-binding domain-containing protein n=1 Tax=Forsythia ovata TaxID=205694 RepID=A0ABD1VQC9_9LAMI
MSFLSAAYWGRFKKWLAMVLVLSPLSGFFSVGLIFLLLITIRESICNAIHSYSHLGGLGIDVAWTEPFDPDDAILKFPNVIITPHVAGVTEYSFLQTNCQEGLSNHEKWWVSTNGHSWLGSDNGIPGGVDSWALDPFGPGERVTLGRIDH